MDIFVYSDESGVFDVAHNDWFVFGGLIFLSKKSADEASRRYIHAERHLSLPAGFDRSQELKAVRLNNKNKGKLFRSLNGAFRFGCVINQRRVFHAIFQSKKDKQRFLDYAYKIAVKRAFQKMIRQNVISPEEVRNISFFVDEHSTATNGRYELHEALEQEFKRGTYNQNYSHLYPPIFPALSGVRVEFCNSASVTLVRAADIVANKLYYLTRIDSDDSFFTIRDKFYNVVWLP